MKFENKNYAFSLDRKAIDDISDIAQSFFAEINTEKKNIVRYRIAIEELLIQWLEKSGGVPVTIKTLKRFFRYSFVIEIDGEAYDPFKNDLEEIGSYSTSLLKTIGVSPEYSRENSTNRFTFRVRKKRKNPIISLLTAVTLAVVIGLLGMLLPTSARTFALDGIISPVHDAFLNLLGCAAGPMMFLSVAWGIYGIGDTTTLSKIGKRMILNYILTLFVIVIAAAALLVPVFNLNFSGASQGSEGFDSVFRLLLGAIPANIISPFVDGNTLQIIYLAFIIGIALLFLGKQTSAVAKAVEQINYIVQFLMEFISKLVPFFIFIVVLSFIWSDTLSVLKNVGKVIVVHIAATIIVAAVMILITGLRRKVSPILLVKKGLPTFLIALTTASSAASFGTNMNACEKKYGIDRTVTSFGIPLGMVMFKPIAAINYLVFALFFAEMYGVECSVGWIVLCVVVVTILSVATPPIPGGAMTAYTLIFLQLGIPVEALSIALAIDMIVDFIDTGFDQFLLPFALISQADRIGRLDSDVLKSE